MTTIEITLSDEIASKVEQAAQDRGVSVQELLQTSVVEKLEREAEFKSATTHVLSKNRELYERLS
jgi:predicted transcriptional regulator